MEIIINNCPGTLAEGYTTYSPIAIKKVFNGKKVNHILDFSYDTLEHEVLDEAVGHLSISGVQEKISMIVDAGKVIPTPEGIQGKYILKPAPDNKRLRNRKQMPANEHLTMQIASQLYKINTAENALIFFNNGEPCYITKRFDVLSDNSKTPQEDFASLAGKTSVTHGSNFKYSGSYLDMAGLIQKYISSWRIEMERFFRLIIFNYCIGNDDAHLKNFSIQQTSDGDFVLTPAYDLLNSSLHITDGSDFALEGGLFDKKHYSEIYIQKGHPCQTDFRTFGELIGLNRKQIEKTISDFLVHDQDVYHLIERSFLDNEMKRMYKKSYDENIARFKRKCDN